MTLGSCTRAAYETAATDIKIFEGWGASIILISIVGGFSVLFAGEERREVG